MPSALFGALGAGIFDTSAIGIDAFVPGVLGDFGIADAGIGAAAVGAEDAAIGATEGGALGATEGAGAAATGFGAGATDLTGSLVGTDAGLSAGSIGAGLGPDAAASFGATAPTVGSTATFGSALPGVGSASAFGAPAGFGPALAGDPLGSVFGGAQAFAPTAGVDAFAAAPAAIEGGALAPTGIAGAEGAVTGAESSILGAESTALPSTSALDFSSLNPISSANAAEGGFGSSATNLATSETGVFNDPFAQNVINTSAPGAGTNLFNTVGVNAIDPAINPLSVSPFDAAPGTFTSATGALTPDTFIDFTQNAVSGLDAIQPALPATNFSVPPELGNSFLSQVTVPPDPSTLAQFSGPQMSAADQFAANTGVINPNTGEMLVNNGAINNPNVFDPINTNPNVVQTQTFTPPPTDVAQTTPTGTQAATQTASTGSPELVEKPPLQNVAGSTGAVTPDVGNALLNSQVNAGDQFGLSQVSGNNPAGYTLGAPGSSGLLPATNAATLPSTSPISPNFGSITNASLSPAVQNLLNSNLNNVVADAGQGAVEGGGGNSAAVSLGGTAAGTGNAFLNSIGLGNVSPLTLAGLGIGAGALGLGIMRANQPLPDQQQLQQLAAQLQSGAQGAQESANQLLQPLLTGQLPPDQAAQVQQAVQDSITATKAKYAQIGMSGSTAETDQIAYLIQKGISLSASLEQIMANAAVQYGNQAISGFNAEGTIFQSLMNAQINQDNALTQAIASFAGQAALAGALGGAKAGSTINLTLPSGTTTPTPTS